MLHAAAAATAVPLTPALSERTGQAVSAGILLYWIFCLILNLLLLYGCFSSIVPADADEQFILDAACADEKIQRQLQGMQIVKTIVVKNKIINLILKPAK